MAQVASSIPCRGAWEAIGSANVNAGRNLLTGIAAIAPNDVWAVGTYVNSGLVYQTLTEHWDGSAWSVVPTPNVGPGNNLFTAVTAIGPGDVWAVGLSRPGNSTTAAQPLTEHWNGNGWTVVSTPSLPNSSTALYSVSGDASNDVWAVGVSIDVPTTILGPRGRPIVIRWNGSSWSVATAPVPQAPSLDLSSLNAVKVLTPTNVWAVGDGLDFTGSMAVSPDTAFIEHWDGGIWTQFTVPAQPNGDFLIDVQGTANDLWAVGGKGQVGSSTSDSVLIVHSTGTTWTEVPGVSPQLSANLFGLGYLGSNNVYAVGASAYANPGTSQEADYTLVERWDGATWTLVMSIEPSTNDAFLAIAAISANDIWASGFETINGYAQTLTESMCAPPVVTNVAPPSGSAGSSVVITGSGFSRAIDVEFGATPAFSFHVDSDTQITAVSPGHKAGMVDVTVTVQGTSAASSADQFTYLQSLPGAAQGSGTFQSRTSAPPPLGVLLRRSDEAMSRLAVWVTLTMLGLIR